MKKKIKVKKKQQKNRSKWKFYNIYLVSVRGYVVSFIERSKICATNKVYELTLIIYQCPKERYLPLFVDK